MVKEGRTCLGLEFFVFEGDETWTKPDEELIEQGKRELAVLGLVDPAQVEAGYVVRMPKAYPFYDAHYKANVRADRRVVEDCARTSIPSGATACTATTTRTTRCTPRCSPPRTSPLARSTTCGAWNVEEEYHEESSGGDDDSSRGTRGTGPRTHR